MSPVRARCGDGLAVDTDLTHAAESASRQALEPLGGQRPDLVCAFVCGDDPAQVAAAGQRVAAVTGAPATLGCSAGGVIGAGRAVEAASAVSVWAAVLPETVVRTFHLEVLRADSGPAVVGMPPRRGDESVGILLTDPYSFPADGVVERLNDTMVGLPFVGGVASGATRPGQTRLFLDGRVVDRGAVGALLCGPLRVSSVVSQGCRPVGPAMTVTRAAGNVLLELAGTSAVGKVRSVLAGLDPQDQALASRGLHIGVAMDEYAEEHDLGDFLIRAVLGADERGGVVVGDVVEVGRTVRLQVRDADSADADLRRLLDRSVRAQGGRTEGALVFSCNGRGTHLFPLADHDVLVVRERLRTTAAAGFFAGGEIGPVGGRNHLHGFTASVLAVGRVPAGEATPAGETAPAAAAVTPELP